MIPQSDDAGGCPPPPALRGRVTDAAGQPVRDAFVMFGGDSPPHHDIGQVTDQDGVFFYPTLPEGTYTVVVRGPTGDMAETKVDVAPQAPQDILITLGLPPEPME